MNVKSIYIFTFITITCSCSKRYFYSDDYKQQENYDSFYVVDTIKIIDPVRIYSTKYGGQFIVSRKTLSEYDNTVKFFYRPDVFYEGNMFYFDLPLKRMHKYKYPDYGGCDFADWQKQSNGLEISEFKTPPRYFILALINANYFYTHYVAFDSKPFVYPENDKKVVYYKVIYPLCK